MTNDSCPKAEYLEIQEEILDLAHNILNTAEIKLAEEISNDLVSSKRKKELARLKLRKLVGVSPSRPLSYANIDLRYLPRYTRNPIRYLGDYVDHLVKFWSSEINGSSYLKKSLGINLSKLKGKINENVRKWLISYNNLCYVPAKHDFKVVGRKHRFTSREAVYICFMTMSLGKEITGCSKTAAEYANSERDDNWAEMKYCDENIDSLCEV